VIFYDITNFNKGCFFHIISKSNDLIIKGW